MDLIVSTFSLMIGICYLLVQITSSLPINDSSLLESTKYGHTKIEQFPLQKLASSRHGTSYGTSYVFVPNNSQSHPGKKSIEVDPLTLILGAKAIALKAYLISQFLTTTTTLSPLK